MLVKFQPGQPYRSGTFSQESLMKDEVFFLDQATHPKTLRREENKFIPLHC